MVDCTRLWLPEQICKASVEELRLALVGWVNEGQRSLDLVVAAACPVTQFSNSVMRQLQEVLDAAETKLPLALRTDRKLRVIGEYVVHSDQISPNGNEGNDDARGKDEKRKDDFGVGWRDKSYQAGEIVNVWAVVSAHKFRGQKNELEWIPYLRSLSLQGCPSFVKDHIVIYKQPVFGSHHFSCSPWTPSYDVSSQSSVCQQQKAFIKRPQWLAAMEQCEAVDMDLTMLELNCATYVHTILKDHWPPAGFLEEHSTTFSICCDYLWSPIAAVMAIWATILYAVSQVLALVLAVWLPMLPYLGSLLQRSITWQAIHIRCQQLMAWPFVLLWGGLGPEQPNVAIAHQMAAVRYSTWSVLLIDKIIGAITGLFLLKYGDLITKLLVENGQMLTNDVLRTGCIWLMRVPAGFKLNNELAEAIGTMSLHIIQSWSTLLYTLIPVIKIFLLVLGSSGVLLGFTVPAAMISDTIYLSTFHISCLHHTVAFLHTNQLRALASLWRLFRGRKRNPLRRRLDTFECSVEQLVVASLMFTPLLLLLPTISVYHTFFSMIFLTLSTVQVLLHYVVAIFHCFPFSLVATWILRPKQFPSGIWFLFLEPVFSENQHPGTLLSTLGIHSASFGTFLFASFHCRFRFNFMCKV